MLPPSTVRTLPVVFSDSARCRKAVLGFIEFGTENHRVCRDFLNGLIDRGLNTEHEILFVIDGARGLYKGDQGRAFGEGGDPALPVAQSGERGVLCG